MEEKINNILTKNPVAQAICAADFRNIVIVKLFSLFLLLILPVMLKAQRLGKPKPSHDIGIMGGGSYYMGDLNPYFPYKNTRLAGGLFYRFNRNSRNVFRLNLIYGQLTASDAKSSLLEQRKRNLSFKSNIYEFSGQWEFNFLPFKLDDPDHFITPYSFFGIGAFYYNPKGNINGKWESLRSLSTEGEGLPGGTKKHLPVSVAIPFGLGIKWAMSKRLTLTVETGMRKTFTDYIDDVSKNYVDPALLAAAKGGDAAALSDKSAMVDYNTGRQRGNPNTKDWYNFTLLTLSYKLPAHNDLCPSYR